MTPREQVEAYIAAGHRIVYWPDIGDQKGPSGKIAKDWPTQPFPIEQFDESYRVGLMCGVEVSPGVFAHDVDIDWADGVAIALALLPSTGFVFGRASKKVSHAWFGSPEPLPSFKYLDVDRSKDTNPEGTTLIELRGTKTDGTLGFQTMVPPSVWSKGTLREPLILLKFEGMTVLPGSTLRQRICLSAIGMIIARNLGVNGFGHEARLAWAGFLLRAGIPVDDLITMGEAMSIYCNNREIHDVRRVVESTAAGLVRDGKKIRGGPALAKTIGVRGKDVVNRINDWLGKDSDFVRDSHGLIVKDHQENIRRAVNLLGKDLSFNSFSARMLIDGNPIEDREMEDLWLRIDEEYRFRPTFQFFEKVIHRMAYDNTFHPVLQYLDSLTWDGVSRIDTWLIDSAQAEDNEFVRAVSSLVLMAAVARIRFPGCKYDEMVILESQQGLQKSSALRALCPRGEWFSDDLPLNTSSQKVIEATLGKWIVEASELAGKRKAETEQLKASLSRQVDGPARMAYARLPIERPRQFIIIGTTNSAVYLTDSTGLRRFWPMKIRKFDVQWITSNRDQLWAEASRRLADGASIRLPERLWPDAAFHQEQRQEIDPWESIIRGAITGVEPSNDGKHRVTTNAVWDALGIEVVRRDRTGSLRITEIMHRLGFIRTRVRPPGGEVEVGFVGQLQPIAEAEEGGGLALPFKLDGIPF